MRNFGRLSLLLFIAVVPASTAFAGSFDIKFGPTSTLVTNRSGGNFDPGRAISIAVANDRTGLVEIAAQGAIQLERVIESDHSNIEVRLLAGTELIAVPSGAVGAFSFSGDHVKLSGPGGITAKTAVNDQVLVSLTGNRCRVEGVTFKSTTLEATSANPMVFVKAYQVQGTEVIHNRFIPKRGFTCIQGVEGNHNRYDSNDFVPAGTGIFEASETAEVTQNPSTTTVLGEVWRCIDLQHDGWATVSNNTARMLGRPEATFAGASPLNYGITVDATAGTYTITTAAPVGAAWYINPPGVGQDVVIAGYSNGGNNGTKTILARDSTSFTVDPTGLVNEVVTSSDSITLTHVGAVADCFLHYEFSSAAATNESGHLHYVGNSVEDFIAPYQVRLLGCRWGRIVGSSFANSLSGVYLGTHAAIYLDAIDSQPTDDILISSNQFHNVAFSGSDGGDIRLAEARRINILGNHFSNNLAEYSVIIDDPDESLDWTVIGNSFEGQSYSLAGNQPTSPIHILGASSAARYVVAANSMTRYSGGMITKDASVTGPGVFETGLQDSSDGEQADGSTTVANLTTNIKNDQ